MVTTHGKTVTHREGLLSTNFYNPLNMRLPEATWQIKHIISPSAEDPWKPN